MKRIILAVTILVSAALSLTAIPSHATSEWSRLGLAAPVSVTHSYILAGQPGQSGIHTSALIRPDAVTGICATNVGNPQCWRQNPGVTGSSATDDWPRDISGDVNQQYAVLYYGQAPNTYCPEFHGSGVFAFVSGNGNGYPISAGYYSGGMYWVGEGAGSSQYWIWNSNGTIQNCWDARNGGYWILQINTPYHQLYTLNVGTGQTWAQVHV